MCMDCNQVNAKLQAEKAYHEQAQTLTPQCGEEARRPPTRELLMSRLRRANDDHERLSKALRILEAHPEFEDFLWLFQSGLV